MSGDHYARRRPIQTMPLELAVALFAGWGIVNGLRPAQAAGMVACLWACWAAAGLLLHRLATQRHPRVRR